MFNTIWEIGGKLDGIDIGGKTGFQIDPDERL